MTETSGVLRQPLRAVCLDPLFGGLYHPESARTGAEANRMNTPHARVAVLVPCYNDEATINQMIQGSVQRCRKRRFTSTTTIRTTGQ
jgi:hypothetical protein